MTAPRWILLALLAFGLGTGVAYAMNPPEPGVPASTAAALDDDLSDIEQYAAAGRCIAVRARLDGAQSRITKLPASTSAEVVRELQQALRRISVVARAECDAAYEAKLPEVPTPTTPEETTPTTPEESTPVEPTDPETTPDPGGNEGGPDPGTGEGGPGDQGDGGTTTPDDTQTDPSGGVAPDIEGVTQKLKKERKKWEKRLRDAQDRWNQAQGLWVQ